MSGFRFGNTHIWTDANVATLREMWPAHSATEIAKKLGLSSRCAVIGKARRLKLQSKANGTTKRVVPQRARPVREEAPVPRVVPPAQPTSFILERGARAVGAAYQLPPLDHCQWPIGDPKEPDFGKCGEPRLKPYPYCEYHKRLSCR